MPTPPTGPISQAQEVTRLTLAASATFQALTGAADANAALERIYHDNFPTAAAACDGGDYTADELNDIRPCARVWTSMENGFRMQRTAAGSSGFEFNDSGVVMVELWRNVPPAIENNDTEVDMTFKNLLGAIYEELGVLAGQGGYLAFQSLVMDEGPFRTHEDERPTKGYGQGVIFSLAWGAPG